MQSRHARRSHASTITTLLLASTSVVAALTAMSVARPALSPSRRWARACRIIRFARRMRSAGPRHLAISNSIGMAPCPASRRCRTIRRLPAAEQASDPAVALPLKQQIGRSSWQRFGSVPANSMSNAGRVTIAAAAVCMQLALGAVYGWSVFLNPLRELFATSKPEANLTFTITLAVLGQRLDLAVASSAGSDRADRFDSKATELLRCREMTRCARNGLMHRSKVTSLIRSPRRRLRAAMAAR